MKLKEKKKKKTIDLSSKNLLKKFPNFHKSVKYNDEQRLRSTFAEIWQCESES